MQEMELINRERSQQDERSVIISLTPKGNDLRSEAPRVGQRLAANMNITKEEAEQLYKLLYKVIDHIDV